METALYLQPALGTGRVAKTALQKEVLSSYGKTESSPVEQSPAQTMTTSLLEHMYEKYADQVFGYLRSLSGSEDVAFDLMQETFLRVNKSLNKRDGAPIEHEKAWLFTIARNLFINNYHREKRFVDGEVPEAAAESKTFNETAWSLLRERIIKKLGEEGEKYVSIFLLRLDYSLTQEQISKATGIPRRSLTRYLTKIRNVIYQNFKDEIGFEYLEADLPEK